MLRTEGLARKDGPRAAQSSLQGLPDLPRPAPCTRPLLPGTELGTQRVPEPPQQQGLLLSVGTEREGRREARDCTASLEGSFNPCCHLHPGGHEALHTERCTGTAAGAAVPLSGGIQDQVGWGPGG